MPNLVVRDLGSVGVVTDANPYDLPSNAFSNCNNVIFDEGRVQRSPVFKQLYPAARSSLTFADVSGTFASNTNTFENAQGGAVSSVRFVGSYADPTAGEVVFVCDNDSTIRAYPQGTLVFQTPGSGTVTNEEPWSHIQVAGISVLARKGMHPYARVLSSGSVYSTTFGDWGANDTATVVRSYLDFIITLNVIKGVTEYPTMVKWCDPVQYGQNLSTLKWDPADTTSSAGENILAELKTGIRDGLVLGNSFVIYAQDQVWLMEYTGSELVFNFRRLFPTGGIINTNCVAEVEGKHFVFGEDDIYMHDGMSKKSLADKRVRRKIFQALDRTKRQRFFVTHDSVANLIYFNYATVADEANFKGTAFCNRSAVYNYREDTWSFMDLPNIAGGAEANIVLSTNQYSQDLGTYQSYDTGYTTFETTSPKLPIMLGVTDTGNGLTESRVYALDLPTIGLVNLPAHQEALKEAFVERTGIDLDESGVALRKYKLVKSITPQAEFAMSDQELIFKIGSSDLPGAETVWRTTYAYKPSEQYKIDTNTSGRYLAYRLSLNDVVNFKFSGFDVEVQPLSGR
jgi:hypothetical protein